MLAPITPESLASGTVRAKQPHERYRQAAHGAQGRDFLGRARLRDARRTPCRDSGGANVPVLHVSIRPETQVTHDRDDGDRNNLPRDPDSACQNAGHQREMPSRVPDRSHLQLPSTAPPLDHSFAPETTRRSRTVRRSDRPVSGNVLLRDAQLGPHPPGDEGVSKTPCQLTLASLINSSRLLMSSMSDSPVWGGTYQ